MTGKPPWLQMKQAFEIFRKKVKVPMEPIHRKDYAELSSADGLWQILEECWSRDPKSRPLAAALLSRVSLVLLRFV